MATSSEEITSLAANNVASSSESGEEQQEKQSFTIEGAENGTNNNDKLEEYENEKLSFCKEKPTDEIHKFLLPSLPSRSKKLSATLGSKILPNSAQVCEKSEAPVVPSSEDAADRSEPSSGHDAKTLPIPYKEPTWSTIPPSGYHFEVLKGGVVVETVPFNKPFLVFGRLAQCDVMLEHPSVSRFHCIVQYRSVASDAAGAGTYVFDLSSTHGTYQNKNRLQPKVYNRIKVGHMLKLGGSTRNFLLMGPDEDAEEELPYSVKELREMAKKKEEEKRQKEEEARVQKEKEDQQKAKEEADRGIDWGMGPDAEEVDEEEEEDPNAPNPFSDMVREELYLDDPKKSLRGWYEREGYDLPEYDVTEITSGRFKCTVKLPVLSPSGEPLIATADHRGKKKDTVVQAALEACRLLDRHGMFRQATHASRVSKAPVVSDSDEEDEFLDRTGDVERKRDRRYVRSCKREKSFTYEELREQHTTASIELKELGFRLLEVQRAKEALTSKDSEKETEDLDAFMRSMNKLVLDKHKMLTWKLKFIELRKEEARLRRLLNVARPANVAEALPPSFPPELVLPGAQRVMDKKVTTPSTSSTAQPLPAGAKGIASGVHVAFLEDDEPSKLKLTKLDTNEDYVPKSIPYDRSVYGNLPRARPRPARPPAKYVVFDDRPPELVDQGAQWKAVPQTPQSDPTADEVSTEKISLVQSENLSETTATIENKSSETIESSSADTTQASENSKELELNSNNSEETMLNSVTNTSETPSSNTNISQESSDKSLSNIKKSKGDMNSEFVQSGSKKRKVMGSEQQQSLLAAVKRASSSTGGNRSKKKAPQLLDFDDPRAEEDWLPPQGQTGDGRTALNDKLGY